MDEFPDLFMEKCDSCSDCVRQVYIPKSTEERLCLTCYRAYLKKIGVEIA